LSGIFSSQASWSWGYLWQILPFSLLDSPEANQMGFQDPATPIMEGIIDFHQDLMCVIIIVSVFVLWLLYRIITTHDVVQDEMQPARQHLTYLWSTARFDWMEISRRHHSMLEFVWTLVPCFILICIAIPSFALLYAMDEIVYAVLTLKIIGRQWYWSYDAYQPHASVREWYWGHDAYQPHAFIKEWYLGHGHDIYQLNDYARIFFPSDVVPLHGCIDSTLVLEEDLRQGDYRLLETDNHIVLPSHTHIRLLVTASDVLHSWAVPSFGIKLDACPGRLNQTDLYIKRAGIYYGQCSEICGVNHGFMPITIEVLV
jgi:cytochrome c oxidase subunit 2